MHGSRSTIGDWPLVELAERQAGLLRHGQLNGLGVSDDAIEARLRTGRLHRRHRGVYTLGHRLLTPRGCWLAAVWAVEGGVLSHLSAAAFYGWVTRELAEQHVTTPGKARSRAGLVVHRVGTLDERDVQRFPLLAVTRRARTILDLAAVLPYTELRTIVDRIRDLDLHAVRQAQQRVPHRIGTTKVRRLLGHLEAHTRSEFERRYLRFCRRNGLPLPDGVNVRVAGFTVDCVYEAARIIVELDGRAFHARQDQMRRDRRRDRKSLRAQFATVRFVWEDFDAEDALETAADLRALIVAA